MLGEFPVIQKMDFSKLKTQPKGRFYSVPRLKHSEFTGSINYQHSEKTEKLSCLFPNATRCKEGISPKCTHKKGNEARKKKEHSESFRWSSYWHRHPTNTNQQVLVLCVLKHSWEQELDNSGSPLVHGQLIQ